MFIKDKLKKAITGGEWFVAFRFKGELQYKLAVAPKNQWCADPFAFEVNGDHYIFVEQYLNAQGKGCIGYFKFENGVPINKGVIIENSYHMSYPNIFEYCGQYYMIPESSANSTVDLYVAENFPDNWRKVKSLITQKKYVDSTVYQDENNYYLISYSMIGGYEVHVFALNMESKELTFLSKKKYKNNVARPGGRLFVENGKLMRPAQDCTRKYGEALIIYEVDSLNNDGEFTEHEVRRITADEFRINNNPERVHQMTYDSLYEIVDVYKEKLDFLHVPKILLRVNRK